MNSMVEHVGKALAGQTEYQMQRKKQRKEERSKYNAKKKKRTNRSLFQLRKYNHMAIIVLDRNNGNHVILFLFYRMIRETERERKREQRHDKTLEGPKMYLSNP